MKKRYLFVLLCWAMLLLLPTACALPADEESSDLSGDTPEDVATNFFASLNEALQDPQLTEEQTRRAWAERLANYFAPTERAEQRQALGEMLAYFAADVEQLDNNQQMTLEVDFSGVQVIEPDSLNEHVKVRLTDATIRYRLIQLGENGSRRILRDQQRPLYEVLGQEEETFPVIQVNGRWFITEG
jgi:hypothetical protein